jgi:hypothetical protein
VKSKVTENGEEWNTNFVLYLWLQQQAAAQLQLLPEGAPKGETQLDGPQNVARDMYIVSLNCVNVR